MVIPGYSWLSMVHSPDVEFRKYIIEARAYEDSEYISEAGGRGEDTLPRSNRARVTIHLIAQLYAHRSQNAQPQEGRDTAAKRSLAANRIASTLKLRSRIPSSASVSIRGVGAPRRLDAMS